MQRCTEILIATIAAGVVTPSPAFEVPLGMSLVSVGYTGIGTWGGGTLAGCELQGTNVTADDAQQANSWQPITLTGAGAGKTADFADAGGTEDQQFFVGMPFRYIRLTATTGAGVITALEIKAYLKSDY